MGIRELMDKAKSGDSDAKKLISQINNRRAMAYAWRFGEIEVGKFFIFQQRRFEKQEPKVDSGGYSYNAVDEYGSRAHFADIVIIEHSDQLGS